MQLATTIYKSLFSLLINVNAAIYLGGFILAEIGRGLSIIKKPYEQIDEGIFELVRLMNSSGEIITIASCHGHPRPYYSPYIYFSSSPEVAEALRLAIESEWTADHNRLAEMWTVDDFNKVGGRNGYLLYSPRYDSNARSWKGAIKNFLIHRQHVINDFNVLSLLVSQSLQNHRKYPVNNNRCA